MLEPQDEKNIPPPKSPVTVKINLTILGLVFDWFFKKYMPTFAARVTSEYRSAAVNAATPGSAANSAHLHGLARDFTLVFAANGQPVPEATARAAYDQFIVPHWPGFTEWEGASKSEGYHIHVGLSREITTYAAMMGLAVLGVLGYKVFAQMGASHD